MRFKTIYGVFDFATIIDENFQPISNSILVIVNGLVLDLTWKKVYNNSERFRILY